MDRLLEGRDVLTSAYGAVGDLKGMVRPLTPTAAFGLGKEGGLWSARPSTAWIQCRCRPS